jgi:hypothetical protein
MDRRRIVTLGRDGRPPLNPDFINLVPNPSVEIDTSGLIVSNSVGVVAGTFARQSGWSDSGGFALRVSGTNAADTTARRIGVASTTGTGGMPVDAGKPYVAQAKINVVSGIVVSGTNGFRLTMLWYQANGSPSAITAAQFGTFQAAPSPGLLTIPVAGTTPADAAFGALLVDATVNTVSDFVDYYVDSLILSPGTTLPFGYADGDTPGWGWTGIPHASASGMLTSTVKDLEDGVSYYAIQDTFQVKPGAPKPIMAERQRRFGGAVPVAETHDNGSIAWTSFVKSTTADGALARAEEIFSTLRAARRDLYVEWRATNATASTFYEVRGPATLSPAYKPRQFADSNSWAVDVEIPVAPLALGLPTPIPISSTTLPAVIALPTAIPGSAPALADVTLRTSGGSNPPIWAMIAWSTRPATTLPSSVAPFGIIEAETGSNLSGWASAADANYRGGNGLKVTASGAGAASAMFALDPSVLVVDDYALSDVDVEIWARVDLAAALVSPKLTLSLQPSAGTAFGGEQFAGDTGGSSGKLLTKPSSGTAFRPVKAGTLSMPVDKTAPLKWNLKVAGSWAAGSSGNFGLDYLWLTVSRQRALGPTGKPNDTSYPDFIASTADTQKRIRGGDLSGLVASGTGNFGRTYGLGGSPIELPPGNVDMLIKLSSLVPDDPGADTTSEQLTHTSVTGSVLVWPRFWLSQGA